MKLLGTSLILGLLLAGGAAVAKDGVQDPTVKARMELMETIGKNTKILGEMAGGKTAYDKSAAEAARDALAKAAVEIPASFEMEADDPVSEARPDIWMNWDAFTEKAKGLEDAVSAIDVASVEGIQAGMGAIGGACKSCHTDFRAKR